MPRAPLAAGVVIAGLAVAGPAIATEQAFQPKPSEVAAGMRRTVQPFGAWTLVCDEDMQKRRRICNVSQVIVDRVGQTAFSWSLAATPNGTPVMILRAPNGPGDGRLARLRFRRSDALTEVPLTQCDESLCLGYLTVTPDLGAQLRQGTEAEITLIREGRPRDIEVPTIGLAEALAALK